MQTVRENTGEKTIRANTDSSFTDGCPSFPPNKWQMANSTIFTNHTSPKWLPKKYVTWDLSGSGPANEMNGSWTPCRRDPTNYVKAWRRMYNIAEQLGVTAYNVFVWSPTGGMPGTEANAMKNYYPGDMFVDWLGVSCYPPSLSATYPKKEDIRSR